MTVRILHPIAGHEPGVGAKITRIHGLSETCRQSGLCIVPGSRSAAAVLRALHAAESKGTMGYQTGPRTEFPGTNGLQKQILTVSVRHLGESA